MYQWLVASDRAEAEELPPPPPIPSLFLPAALGLKPWRGLHPLLRGLVLLGFAVLALLGLTSTGPKESLGLLAGFLVAAFFLRLTSVPRWHALEHRAAHVLDGEEVPLEEEELKEALARASSFHPRCGTVLAGVFVLASAAFVLVLPLTVALLLGWLAAEGAARRGWEQALFPIQGLFLAKPKPEELEAAARGLARLLKDQVKAEVASP